MKIHIQAFWNAEVSSLKTDLDIENQLKRPKPPVLCAIIIDGQLRGEVVWDGKELSISKELVKPRVDLNP